VSDATDGIDGIDKIDDELLRPAIDLALAVAVAGSRMRPPLPSPAVFAPLLRLQKVPPTSLRSVRAGIEGDDRFRERVAKIATKNLVGEVGMLWLSRPDGWRQALAGYGGAAEPQKTPVATRPLAAERTATAAAKKLAAAEDAVRAEHVRRVTAERATREQQELVARLTKRLATAERSGTAARERLAEAQLRHRDDQQTMKVLRSALASAEAARDDALASRAAFEVGPESRSDLGLGPVRRPPARRQPLGIPGGMHGDTGAAAIHLLRHPGVLLLVDGYNVAKLGWPELTLEQQRSALLQALDDLVRRIHTRTVVVFDGSEVGAFAPGRRLVRVTFTDDGVTADDEIRRVVHAQAADQALVVVTNDRQIITDVRRLGANVISSDTLTALLHLPGN
jgi:predicted RNA-binding protein with PIN domain